MAEKRNGKAIFLEMTLAEGPDVPQHLKLFESIKREICLNRFAVGTALPSERQMSETYKMNRYSVHRAYDSLLEEKWVTEVPGKRGLFVSQDAKINYTPAVPCIGIVLPNSFSEFYSVSNQMSLRYFSGVVDNASNFGYSTMILTLPPLDTANDIVEKWVNDIMPTLAGIVYFNARSPHSDSAIERMISRKEVPQVFITGESGFSNISTVCGDIKSGGTSAAELFREHGHSKLGILGAYSTNHKRGNIFRSMSFARCDIMRSCFKQCNIEVCDDWSLDDCLDKKKLLNGLTHLFSQPEKPTALWCQNDQIALTAVNILNDMGMDVPNDVSIIGYDNIEGMTNSSAFLTTIQHPHYSIGCKAIEIIDNLYNNGAPGEAKKIEIPTSLVCRQSVGPLKLQY